MIFQDGKDRKDRGYKPCARAALPILPILKNPRKPSPVAAGDLVYPVKCLRDKMEDVCAYFFIFLMSSTNSRSFCSWRRRGSLAGASLPVSCL